MNSQRDKGPGIFKQAIGIQLAFQKTETMVNKFATGPNKEIHQKFTTIDQDLPMWRKIESFKNGVQIRRKAQNSISMTGCDAPVNYHIYGRDDKGNKKGETQFIWKDSNSWLDKYPPGTCKEQTILCTNQLKNNLDDQSDICLRMTKECRCGYYCFNRQEILIEYVDNGFKTLGKIIDPWNLLKFQFMIYDDHNQPVYSIEASCAQPYFWCKCPCDGCTMAEFEIREGSSLDVLGKVTKEGTGCCGLGAQAVECMTIEFPEKADWRKRAL
jgi:hypothetical protein